MMLDHLYINKDVFPPNSKDKDGNKPQGLKPCSSKDFNVVGEWLNSREPMALLQHIDMIEVEAP